MRHQDAEEVACCSSSNGIVKMSSEFSKSPDKDQELDDSGSSTDMSVDSSDLELGDLFTNEDPGEQCVQELEDDLFVAVRRRVPLYSEKFGGPKLSSSNTKPKHATKSNITSVGKKMVTKEQPSEWVDQGLSDDLFTAVIRRTPTYREKFGVPNQSISYAKGKDAAKSNITTVSKTKVAKKQPSEWVDQGLSDDLFTAVIRRTPTYSEKFGVPNQSSSYAKGKDAAKSNITTVSKTKVAKKQPSEWVDQGLSDDLFTAVIRRTPTYSEKFGTPNQSSSYAKGKDAAKSNITTVSKTKLTKKPPSEWVDQGLSDDLFTAVIRRAPTYNEEFGVPNQSSSSTKRKRTKSTITTVRKKKVTNEQPSEELYDFSYSCESDTDLDDLFIAVKRRVPLKSQSTAGPSQPSPKRLRTAKSTITTINKKNGISKKSKAKSLINIQLRKPKQKHGKKEIPTIGPEGEVKLELIPGGVKSMKTIKEDDFETLLWMTKNGMEFQRVKIHVQNCPEELQNTGFDDGYGDFIGNPPAPASPDEYGDFIENPPASPDEYGDFMENPPASPDENEAEASASTSTNTNANNDNVDGSAIVFTQEELRQVLTDTTNTAAVDEDESDDWINDAMDYFERAGDAKLSNILPMPINGAVQVFIFPNTDVPTATDAEKTFEQLVPLDMPLAQQPSSDTEDSGVNVNSNEDCEMPVSGNVTVTLPTTSNTVSV